MRFEDLKDSKIAILGMGREGQAVWRQLRRRYPIKTIHLFAENKGDEGFVATLDPAQDHCHIGPFSFEKLQQFDVLVRSAGISPYRDELERLRAHGVRFTTASSLWFAENPSAKTICITGTKGKSTTAALTAHLLNKAGVSACLSGNIGRPMLDCETTGVDWWVIELSSYQLCDLQAKPDIGLLLNLSDEHIDWHGGADRYRDDKLKLAALAGQGKLIANHADSALVHGLQEHSDIIWFNRSGNWQSDADRVIDASSGRIVQSVAALPGEHNMQNLAAALTVVDVLGLQIDDPGQALKDFGGLPHRLQTLGEKDGICYVDDSISTTPLSVCAALNTIGFENVVLLLGGLDRGLDWSGFANDLVAGVPHAIITMPDNGSHILQCLKNSGLEPAGGLHAADNLSQAVATAKRLVPTGGFVLLSPGAPSFPHFRDFEDRGDQFAHLAGF